MTLRIGKGRVGSCPAALWVGSRLVNKLGRIRAGLEIWTDDQLCRRDVARCFSHYQSAGATAALGRRGVER